MGDEWSEAAVVEAAVVGADNVPGWSELTTLTALVTGLSEARLGNAAHLICSPASCVSNLARTGDSRISRRSSRRCACDGRAARMRERSVRRAILRSLVRAWSGGASLGAHSDGHWTQRWRGNGEELSILL